MTVGAAVIGPVGAAYVSSQVLSHRLEVVAHPEDRDAGGEDVRVHVRCGLGADLEDVAAPVREAARHFGSQNIATNCSHHNSMSSYPPWTAWS